MGRPARDVHRENKHVIRQVYAVKVRIYIRRLGTESRCTPVWTGRYQTALSGDRGVRAISAPADVSRSGPKAKRAADGLRAPNYLVGIRGESGHLHSI